MKELINKLNSQMFNLESIESRLSAINNFIDTMAELGENIDAANNTKTDILHEKAELISEMLSTSSQITKLLYDGAV